MTNCGIFQDGEDMTNQINTVEQASKALWDQIHMLSWWCGHGIGKTADGKECLVIYVCSRTAANRWLSGNRGSWDGVPMQIVKSGKFYPCGT